MNQGLRQIVASRLEARGYRLDAAGRPGGRGEDRDGVPGRPRRGAAGASAEAMSTAVAA